MSAFGTIPLASLAALRERIADSAAGFADLRKHHGPLVAFCWRNFWRGVNALGVPAALACFWYALEAVQPDGFAILSARYVGNTGGLPVANVAVWPLHYVWLVLMPAKGLSANLGEALILAAVGTALMVLVSYLNLARQTVENKAGKNSVSLWFMIMGLTGLDYLRCGVLPETWDNQALFAGLSNGETLRAAEIIVSAGFVSLLMVTMNSRVNPGIMRPWGWLSFVTWQGATLRIAGLIALWPIFFPHGARSFLLWREEWQSGGTGTHVLVALSLLCIAYALRFLWWPLLRSLRIVIGFGLSIEANRIITKPSPPPGFGRRSP